jgi:probable rRNA maturation factor
MRLDRGQGVDEVDIIIEAPEWELALPDVLGVVERAAAAALQATTPAAGHWQTAILLGYDATLRELNRRFRGQDKPTNVLAFPAAPAPAPAGRAAPPRPPAEQPAQQRGDIALAFETVEREAAEQGKRLADHLSHLVVHGLLHLLGHDHLEAAEAERMEALERAILWRIGIADPYAAESLA